MQYSLNYFGTRFLSTENQNYSISWWILSKNFRVLQCPGAHSRDFDSVFLCLIKSFVESNLRLGIMSFCECVIILQDIL